MTNSTDMMEEGGKRKLLQEMMDEGMVDMPNMSNMTNSTDMMEEGGKRKLLQDMMEGVVDMPNMTNMTEGTSIGIGIDESATSDKRKLLQDEGMVDMPNMTNSTDMMEEGGKRKLL